jgi:hypothetical protein
MQKKASGMAKPSNIDTRKNGPGSQIPCIPKISEVYILPGEKTFLLKTMPRSNIKYVL